jgi:hypothetical protein
MVAARHTKSLSSFNLALGKIRDAWLEYPRTRSQLSCFPRGRAIFISGTHRSGTTWVARMLAVPGLWYVHEPFNPNKHVWNEAFSYVPTDGSNENVDRHMDRVLRGGFRSASLSGPVDHPLMPLRLLKPPIRRVMVKDPLACLLTGYLTRRFDLQSFVLFRHPCGFVASVTRLGWPSAGFLKEFLNRRELMDDYLAPHSSMMERYSNEDSIESAAVLHGILNLVLWRQVGSLAIPWFRFKDLCADPIDRFREIFNLLGLPYSEAVEQQHAKLCLSGSSSSADYRPHAVARQSQAMAESWRQEIDGPRIQTIREIWDRFEIPVYEDNEDW